MEFWTGSQGQLPLYAKFGTVPGRYFSHAYQDKPHTADYQQYSYEQPDRLCEPSCWTVPGSRTGGVLQDYTNWTDLPPPPPNFPFSLDNQPYPQGLSEHAGQEREWLPREIQRAQKERQREKDRERGMQGEGWTKRWEPCSPVHSRRDGAKRSLSDSSYRELEAWATRYCHSLPRKRRLEAGMWGGAQGVPGNERVLKWVGRVGAEPPQIPAAHLSTQTREWGQWERRDTQHLPPYSPPPGLPNPERTWRSNIKENKSSLQRAPFSQPPCYIPPPPYNAPHNGNISAGMQHPEKYVTKDTIMTVDPGWEQQLGNRSTYCTLPATRRPEYYVNSRTERGREFAGGEWKQRADPDLDVHRGGQRGQVALGTWEGSHAPPQRTQMQLDSPAPHQHPQPLSPGPRQITSPDVAGSGQTKLKKRRGGETVFCLVSRMGGLAGLSSSPEEPLKSHSLPLFTVSPLTGMASVTECASMAKSIEGGGESYGSLQLADEVDSRALSQQHQYDSLMPNTPAHTLGPKTVGDPKPIPKGVPDWMGNEQAAAHREELLRAIQQCGSRQEAGKMNFHSLPNKIERDLDSAMPECSKTSASSPETRKSATQPRSQTSVKFPLWREPKWHCHSKGGWEPRNELGKDTSCDPRSEGRCEHPIDVEVRQSELKDDSASDNSSGILVIDATCVVVKVEFIFPPKKEHVQYVCSPPCDPPDPLVLSDTIQQNIHNDYVTPEQDTDISGIPDQNCPLPSDKEELEEELLIQELDNECKLSLSLDTMETGSPHSVSDRTIEETSQCPKSISAYPEIPAMETLEERAVRILGIQLQDSSNHEQIKENELSGKTNSEQSNDQECPTEVPLEVPSLEWPAEVPLQESSSEWPAEVPLEEPSSEWALKVPLEEPSSEWPAEVPLEEPSSEWPAEVPLEEPSSEWPAEVPLEEPSSEWPAEVPLEEPSSEWPAEVPLEEPSSEWALKVPLEEPSSEWPAEVPLEEPSSECLLEVSPQEPSSEASSEQIKAKVVCMNEAEVTLEEVEATAEETETTLDDQFTAEKDKDPEISCTEPVTCDFFEGKATECPQEVQDISYNTSDVMDKPTLEPCSQISPETFSQLSDEPCSSSLTQCLTSAPSYLDSPPCSPSNSPSRYSSRSPSPFLYLLESSSLISPSPPQPNTASESLSEFASLSDFDISLPTQSLPISSLLPDCISLSRFPSPPPTLSVPISPSSSPPPPGPSSVPQSTQAPVEVSLPIPPLSPQHREEPQYPKSLWDAVNRIRKHTAPDSENEEEEGNELWENSENASEEADELDLESNVRLGLEDPTTISTSLEGVGHLEMVGDEVTIPTTILDEEQNEDEAKGQAEDDTLSCSSSDSHTSRDTVIMGEGDTGASETEGEEEVSEDPDSSNQAAQENSKSGEEVCSVTEDPQGDITAEWVGESGRGGETKVIALDTVDNQEGSKSAADENGDLAIETIYEVTSDSIKANKRGSVCPSVEESEGHSCNIDATENISHCDKEAEEAEMYCDPRHEEMVLKAIACSESARADVPTEENLSDQSHQTGSCRDTGDAKDSFISEPGN